MSTPAAPDWDALADGRVHRLRAGRDFRGDVRAHIRDAKATAARLDRHVVVARDDFGNSSFLWVQFLDGIVPAGAACPGCGERALARPGPGLARCGHCGRRYAVRRGPIVDAPEAHVGLHDDSSAADSLRELRAAGMLDPGAPVPRDAAFVRAAGEVAAARGSQMGLDRLWTVWQAAGAACRLAAPAVAISSAWASGGALLAVAMRHRSGGTLHAVVVDHPWFDPHRELLSEDDHAAVRDLLAGHEATVVRGDVEHAAEALRVERYGAAQVDLTDPGELAAALELLDEVLVAGAVVVVEDVPEAPSGDKAAERVAVVEGFLEDHDGYWSWREATGQLLLSRTAAEAG